MRPGYIGLINFAPKDHRDPDMWRLEEPFGQVTSDGHLILCQPWKRTDGASIPRCLWGYLGHPFEGSNAFWSQPHDQGYNGQAFVLDVITLLASDVYHIVENPDTVINYADLTRSKSRLWFDRAMREAMSITGDSRMKRNLAYAGVRLGGWKPWNEVRSC